jgi:hypothetical protein
MTEVELNVVRQRFRTLVDDLVKAGLGRHSTGLSVNQKAVAYLLRRTGAPNAQSISASQWETFFRQVDGVRFDLSGLAAYIDSIQVSQESPSFSESDLEMLKDLCVSPQDDVRVY